MAKGNRLNPLAYLLMSGHICVDMVQGGIAAVIPFLVVHNGFSYASATMLVLAANIASAIIQPLFGWIGDRKANPWLMGAGVMLAGLGMTGIGYFESYIAVVLSALASGVGNAMLHPEGGRIAYLIGGSRKAESMSVFSVGGQIGFCVGPILTVAAVTAFGLHGMAVYLAICIPTSVILLAFDKRFRSYGIKEVAAGSLSGGTDRWGVFSLIVGACSIRSIVFYGITSFMPLVIMTTFNQSEGFSSSLITVFAAVGAFATLASGKVVRHVKTQHVIIGCFVALVAALTLFTVSPSLALSIMLLMVMAVCVNLFNPPAVTLGQSYLPQHLGMASGITFGMAVAVGGVASPLLGMVGDANGLTFVMWTLVVVAFLGLIFGVAINAVIDKASSEASYRKGRRSECGQ